MFGRGELFYEQTTLSDPVFCFYNLIIWRDEA